MLWQVSLHSMENEAQESEEHPGFPQTQEPQRCVTEEEVIGGMWQEDRYKAESRVECQPVFV